MIHRRTWDVQYNKDEMESRIPQGWRDCFRVNRQGGGGASANEPPRMTKDEFVGTDFGGGTIQKYEGVRNYFDLGTTGK